MQHIPESTMQASEIVSKSAMGQLCSIHNDFVVTLCTPATPFTNMD